MTENTSGWTQKVRSGEVAGLRMSSSQAQGLGQPGDEGLEVLVIEREDMYAMISLQGAQLLSCRLAGEPDFFWISPKTRMQPGVAIRGGVPICSPWFGVNRHDPESTTKHGFLRLEAFQIVSIEAQNDALVVVLQHRYQAGEEDQRFPASVLSEVRFTFGAACEIELQTKVSGAKVPFSCAFHSYYAVNDVRSVEITGLESYTYLDNTDDLSRHLETGAIAFPGEVDRVYLDVKGTQHIIDRDRILSVDGNNAPTAIIWNPGAELGAAMVDVGTDNHAGFVCVERGAAFDNELKLAPEDVFTCSVRFSQSQRQK